MKILDHVRSSAASVGSSPVLRDRDAVKAELVELAKASRNVDVNNVIDPHPFLPDRDARGRLLKGHSGHPGGMSNLRRAFIDRLKQEDSDLIYRVFMELVCERNVPAVLKAVEYVAGKPKEHIELSSAPTQGLDLRKLTTEQLENFERLLAIVTE